MMYMSVQPMPPGTRLRSEATAALAMSPRACSHAIAGYTLRMPQASSWIWMTGSLTRASLAYPRGAGARTLAARRAGLGRRGRGDGAGEVRHPRHDGVEQRRGDQLVAGLGEVRAVLGADAHLAALRVVEERGERPIGRGDRHGVDPGLACRDHAVALHLVGAAHGTVVLLVPDQRQAEPEQGDVVAL